MHNEVLELFRAFSFFGLIIFYGIVLKPIFIFFRKFKIQALTFLLIIFTMFVLTVAAGEAAIGLAILVVFFRNKGSIHVEDINTLKG